MINLKLVITDIDGVWTDGGMYYDNLGNELKKFNTSDSAGVKFLKLNNIDLAIITGENTNIVKRRSEKLGIRYIKQGSKNKIGDAKKIWKDLDIKPEETAYIGDDLIDLGLLKIVGISGCPNSSPDYIKRHCKWVGEKNGGDGVFREFVEYLLSQNNLLEKTLDKIYNENNF
jgi:3-deoxy-D-manno-octulosonate 8-phosphate phosphatase (KDO 8-P phosphatase)